MITEWWHPALRAFNALEVKEQLFVRARLWSAPLELLARRVEGPRVLEVGCGHGVLLALIEQLHPDFQIFGVDPDPRKVDWAERSVGRLPAVHVHQGTLSTVSSEQSLFDTIVVADVLYLLTRDERRAFFDRARKLLRAQGQLLVKEVEPDGSWRAAKAWAQEQVMVRVLGRTQSSGAVALIDRETFLSDVKAAGFAVRSVEAVSRGYTTPHVLFDLQSA